MNPKQEVEAKLWGRMKTLSEVEGYHEDDVNQMMNIAAVIKTLDGIYYDDSPELDMQFHDGPHCACVPQKGRLPLN